MGISNYLKLRQVPYIGVIGSAFASPKELELAEEVGWLLGKRNVILVCGGRGGVMQAACKGAAAAGGITLGILPGITREEANPFVSISIPTGLDEARNALVVRACDGVIAISGGYGTLSEIGHALKLGIPLVGLHTWRISSSSGDTAPVFTADTPREAVQLILELVRSRRSFETPVDEPGEGLQRMYPTRPMVGVSATVFHEGKVLLVQRKNPPSQGQWQIPGGLVRLGESLQDAVKREILEECGIEIEVLSLFKVVERISSGSNGDILYHYVIVNYVAKFLSGTLAAGSDAKQAGWFSLRELNQLNLAGDTLQLVKEAMSARPPS